jgi:hypothetical protein
MYRPSSLEFLLPPELGVGEATDDKEYVAVPEGDEKAEPTPPIVLPPHLGQRSGGVAPVVELLPCRDLCRGRKR